MDYFKKLERQMVFDRVSKGQYTGLQSRLLSHLNLLVLVFLACLLILNRLYIPLIILGSTIFAGNFSLLIFIGLTIYLSAIKFWLGVAIIIAMGIIGQLSVIFGSQHTKRVLYSNKLTKNIDPFEGMMDMLPLTILEFIFFAVGIMSKGILSVIALSIFLILLFLNLYRYWYRYSEVWRRIHFSFMVRYAAKIGYAVGLTERDQKEAKIDIVLTDLLKEIIQDWSSIQAQQFLDIIKNKIEKFSEKSLFVDIFRKIIVSDDKVQELVDKFGDKLKSQNDKGLFIRYVIAELIEKDYGIEEKKKYFEALLTGRAI